MKEIINEYAAFNTWANNLLLTTVLSLTEGQQHAEVQSSFPSLYKTILHMMDASNIWWQRLKLQEKTEWFHETFAGDMQALASSMQQQDKQWQDWVNNANEHALQHEFIYYNSRKERFKQPVYQMLMHLFNHNTYHRGQIVTMLRQLGVEKIPATDFIVWNRRKNG